MGQEICTLKYADDLLLLAKEEMVLQGMIGRLIEIGRCCGMKVNVGKSKVMRILRQSCPLQIMIDKKQMEYFSCLASKITNDAMCV